MKEISVPEKFCWLLYFPPWHRQMWREWKKNNSLSQISTKFNFWIVLSFKSFQEEIIQKNQEKIQTKSGRNPTKIRKKSKKNPNTFVLIEEVDCKLEPPTWCIPSFQLFFHVKVFREKSKKNQEEIWKFSGRNPKTFALIESADCKLDTPTRCIQSFQLFSVTEKRIWWKKF